MENVYNDFIEIIVIFFVGELIMPKVQKAQFIQKNMVSYAKEYRGVSFYKEALNEADSLILSQIVYFDYRDTVFEKEDFSHTLYDLIHERKKKAWGTRFSEDQALLNIFKFGGRHGGLRGSNYIDVTDTEMTKQFAALTFEITPGIYYIAFRGTDNSLTGWREDMNMDYHDVVPAQEDALKYAVKIMETFEGMFYFGGHSKGGNLAVYAAMNLPVDYKKRLIAIYNHDGPGFSADVYDKEEYRSIRPIIKKTVPQSCIVGLMWERDDQFEVIHSKALGVWQHNPYSWILEDNSFKRDELEESAKTTKRVLERWVGSLPVEHRKFFINMIFDTLEKTEAEKFYDFTDDSLNKMKKLSDGISEIKQEDKELMKDVMKKLLDISKEEMRAGKEK